MRILIRIIIILTVILPVNAQKWQAPADAKLLDNPLTGNVQTVENGRKLYLSLCVACHGKEGKGNGVAAAGMNPKPADFTTAGFQRQSDGEIFWKLSEGRGLMAAYNNMLSEEERWSIINYLRTLKVSPSLNEKDKKTSEPVRPPFLFNQLINSQTTELIPGGAYEFTIQHRFGATKLDESFITNFLGMDLASNIRIAFAYGINDRLQVDVGRTKFGKYYDASLKYSLMRQTAKRPINITAYTNLAVMTDRFPELGEGAQYEGGGNFEYTFNHRMTYTHQLIFSRRFSNAISAEIALVAIWRNLAPPGSRNLLFSTPLGLRWKVSPKGSILVEAMPEWLEGDKQMPLSLAYEIASSGAHAFQLILTSTDAIPEHEVSHKGYDYTKGFFVLGFNIKRVF